MCGVVYLCSSGVVEVLSGVCMGGLSCGVVYMWSYGVVELLSCVVV